MAIPLQMAMIERDEVKYVERKGGGSVRGVGESFLEGEEGVVAKGRRGLGDRPEASAAMCLAQSNRRASRRAGGLYSAASGISVFVPDGSSYPHKKP